MDIHNLTAKERKKIHTWLRALIQLLYFIFIPSVYTAAFAGVKYIFTKIGAGEKVAMTSETPKQRILLHSMPDRADRQKLTMRSSG